MCLSRPPRSDMAFFPWVTTDCLRERASEEVPPRVLTSVLVADDWYVMNDIAVTVVGI